MNQEETKKYLEGKIHINCSKCGERHLRANCAYYALGDGVYLCSKCHIDRIDSNLKKIGGVIPSRISYKPNQCASCGSSDIDYKGCEADKDSITQPYICNSCGRRGEEFYEIIFKHNIVT